MNLVDIVRLEGVFRDSWMATRAEIELIEEDSIYLELTLPEIPSGGPKVVFIDDG